MGLSRIEISGFKSFSNAGVSIDFGTTTLLLGANGSGKSNLVSFFQMLEFAMTGGLKNYVEKYDVATLLHYGPKVTETVKCNLIFDSESGKTEYEIRFSYGLPDRLFISGERVSFARGDRLKPQEYFLESHEGGPGILVDLRQTSKVLKSFLWGLKSYQFHDTSEMAAIRRKGNADDVKYVRRDAGNLAAFLKMLKESDEFNPYYKRIVRHIQKVMPQFGDFSVDALPNNGNEVRLNWTDIHQTDYLFSPHQISDGSLRFMALATLLLQPPSLLPKFIVIDEPELGLHPTALVELTGIMKIAQKNCQLLLATQSTRLVDEFGIENLVIADRHPGETGTQFSRKNPEQIKPWLEEYSLSELWEKNVLGGLP